MGPTFEMFLLPPTFSSLLLSLSSPSPPPGEGLISSTCTTHRCLPSPCSALRRKGRRELHAGARAAVPRSAASYAHEQGATAAACHGQVQADAPKNTHCREPSAMARARAWAAASKKREESDRKAAWLGFHDGSKRSSPPGGGTGRRELRGGPYCMPTSA